MKTHSQKFLQQRRFYMVMPVLVLPFITLLFWALGGGQGNAADKPSSLQVGLNLELPKAHFSGNENELWDKFELYEQAKRDSMKNAKARQDDPYYQVGRTTDKIQQKAAPDDRLIKTPSGQGRYSELQRNETRINEKLEQLTSQLEQSSATPVPQNRESQHIPNMPQYEMTSDDEDIARLEKMMRLMGSGEMNDPEMEKIDQMLDKILAIQYPEQMALKNAQTEPPVLPVAAATADDNITVVESNDLKLPSMDSTALVTLPVQNGFYGLDEEEFDNGQATSAIEAVIHSTQTVVSGATVKMRLLNDVVIGGQSITAGTFVFGECSINGDRLKITIRSIRDEKALLPVALTVYDLDGMPGIYVPGAMTREAAKQASGQAIQGMQLYSMDPSLEAQAASAGIEAAKGLFSKKVKLIKITLKAGYKILLQDGSAV